MKVEAHIYALHQSHNDSYAFVVSGSRFADDGPFIHIELREIEFDEPPRDVLQTRTIATYRAEQQKIRAEAHKKVANIQEQIDKMLSIEHKPEVA